MSLQELDKKGRLTIPKNYRRGLGLEGKVLLVDAGDHLVVIPVPKDPVAGLKGAFSTRRSFGELKRHAEAEAAREASRKG